MSRPTIDTKKMLSSLAHAPKKKLGQNFLVDPNIPRVSTRMAALQEGDVVVEVGPGLGVLSEAILETGAQLYAVEFDARLAEHLRVHFANEPRFHLDEADALKSPVGKLPVACKQFSIIANLPYAISSPWLDAILSMDRLPMQMVLLMQLETVDRLCSSHGCKNYGALSLFLSCGYDAIHKHKVSRNCFYPKPDVDSAIIHLRRKPEPHTFHVETRQIIRILFTQRRKQIGHLSQRHERSDVLNQWLDSSCIERNLRPEQIAPEEWMALDFCMRRTLKS